MNFAYRQFPEARHVRLPHSPKADDANSALLLEKMSVQLHLDERYGHSCNGDYSVSTVKRFGMESWPVFLHLDASGDCRNRKDFASSGGIYDRKI